VNSAETEKKNPVYGGHLGGRIDALRKLYGNQAPKQSAVDKWITHFQR